jgi:fumarate reductase subunit C
VTLAGIQRACNRRVRPDGAAAIVAALVPILMLTALLADVAGNSSAADGFVGFVAVVLPLAALSCFLFHLSASYLCPRIMLVLAEALTVGLVACTAGRHHAVRDSVSHDMNVKIKKTTEMRR